MKLMSFNVLTSAKKDAEIYDRVLLREDRIPPALEMIQELHPDVIGLQEVSDVHRQRLESAPSLSEYGMVGSPAVPELHEQGVYVMYDRTKYQLLTWGIKWLSETVDEEHSYVAEAAEENANVLEVERGIMHQPRKAVYAILEDKKSKRCFGFCNTHLGHTPVGSKPGVSALIRQKQAAILTEQIASGKMFEQGMPFVIVGDMNSQPEMMPWQQFTRIADDARSCAFIQRSNLQRTLHKYQKEIRDNQIDYIFLSKNDFRCLDFEIITKEYYSESLNMNILPSDHYALVAEAELLPKKHNVLYIHTHDTGRYISAYGKAVPTENLRKFAGDSVVFRNAFCVSPTCSPSRGAMLTGRYPHQNGLIGLAHRGFALTDPDTHLAAYLGENGYETVLAGVQHEEKMYNYREESVRASEKLGYQKNISYLGPGEKKCDRWKIDQRNTERVVKWLDSFEGDKPFFLSFGMFETHRTYPELPMEESYRRYADYLELPAGVADTRENRQDTARLHDALRFVDENFAAVIDALKRNGLYDNTVIVFTTDHGLANPFAKSNLTDEGLGVSLMMRIPGYEAMNGRVYDGLVSHLDVYPTLCDVLGLSKPGGLEGTSLLPVFNGREEEIHEAVYGEMNFHTSYEPARSVRTKRYKYIRYYDEEWQRTNLSNCDNSGLKNLLLDFGWDKKHKELEYLFDLYYDPTERNNLVGLAEYEPVLQEMRGLLEQWRERTKDRIPDPHDYVDGYEINDREDICP